nr:hypothetical protein [uncultured Aeromicrobium sp.]
MGAFSARRRGCSSYPVVLVVAWACCAVLVDSAVFASPVEAWHGVAANLESPHYRASMANTIRLLAAACHTAAT